MVNLQIRKIILLLFISILIGGCASPLKREIWRLDEPRGDEIIRIDNTVKEYIPLGSSKEQTIKTLKSSGFKVIEEQKHPNNIDFEESDDVMLLGINEFRKSISLFPDYRLVVEVGFQQETVNIVKAHYMTFKLWHRLP
jgi:hypothetical protein